MSHVWGGHDLQGRSAEQFLGILFLTGGACLAGAAIFVRLFDRLGTSLLPVGRRNLVRGRLCLLAAFFVGAVAALATGCLLGLLCGYLLPQIGEGDSIRAYSGIAYADLLIPAAMAPVAAGLGVSVARKGSESSTIVAAWLCIAGAVLVFILMFAPLTWRVAVFGALWAWVVWAVRRRTLTQDFQC